ncbi:MAG: PIN domain-containing protein [Deltaproteobacteria bacterium]|jgi:predicted nucleic acid-binding protein
MLFVDTWGWVALHNKRETRHDEVKSFYRQYQLRGAKIYTTDYVLDETLTLIFRRLPLELAKISMKSINDSIVQGYLHLVWVSTSLFEEAKVMRLRYDDKPLISFTDLTSMAVMKEIGVTDVITGDEHFEHVGMGFQRRP